MTLHHTAPSTATTVLGITAQALEHFGNGYKIWHMSLTEDGTPQSGAIG
jgi:hypothetical protein